MIAATRIASQPDRWQRAQADAITDPDELLAVLGLDPALAGPARRIAARFPLKVPRGFVARMRQGDPADPLLRQVLPLDAEFDDADGFVADPVGDLASVASPGVLHKYQGRALLVATGACAVHCRYCFRREFPYGGQLASAGRWRDAVATIAGDRTITEVILSGGDPLSLSDARLAELSCALKPIRHIERLRIHTRQPVVLPERIDDSLLAWLGSLPWPVAMVIHANHAQELDDTVASALAAIRARGITLLNQSVLLAGVNDSVAALAGLSSRLFGLGVLPYYLHLLDRVRGAAHFEVGEAAATALVTALRDELPGYLVPRLVREQPGARSKTPVAV